MTRFMTQRVFGMANLSESLNFMDCYALISLNLTMTSKESAFCRDSKAQGNALNLWFFSCYALATHFCHAKATSLRHHAIFVKTAHHNKKHTNKYFLKQNAQILAVLAYKPACKHGVFIIKYRHLPACKGINRL